MNRLTRYVAAALALSALALTSTGCSTLIGNVKPVDEKSASYGVADLAKEQPRVWEKLDPAQVAGEEEITAEKATEISDAVYQSRKTSATISINSSCRPGGEGNHSLQELTQLLVMGIVDVKLREEKPIEVSNSPALQTTLRGQLNGEDVMLRTVVTRKSDCVYDLVYLSPPKQFAIHEPDFTHFVASLRLR